MKQLMNKFTKSRWIFLSFLGLLLACQSETKTNDEALKFRKSSEERKISDLEVKDLVYAWVDKLNIRAEANTKGKIVASVQSSDALEFTGEKSGASETIVLRGVVYDEPWLKVFTKNKTEGWVYGGAVKEKGSSKGNAEISDTKFDFPHFGSFDLSAWEKLPVLSGEEGDAEFKTYTYKNKETKKILESKKTELGEYGYYRNYKLLDENKKVLKEREFSFQASEGLNELNEVVKDYSTKKQFERKQKVKKHFMQLNAKPEMVNGAWLTSELVIAKELQVFTTYDEFPKEITTEDGCSCSFRNDANNYKAVIFESTFDEAPNEKAVIRIDGEFVLLKSAKFPNSDTEKGDYFAYYYNDTYELKIVATEDGKDDGGGSKYSGTMKLTLKDGTVLTNIKTFGSCGC